MSLSLLSSFSSVLRHDEAAFVHGYLGAHHRTDLAEERVD